MLSIDLAGSVLSGLSLQTMAATELRSSGVPGSESPVVAITPSLLQHSALANVQKMIVAGSSVASPSDSPSLRVDANTADSPYAGVGSLRVSYESSVYIGSATAISPTHVLTAAHMLDLDDNGTIDVSPGDVVFNLNVGGNLTSQIVASNLFVHPDWTGFDSPVVNDDVAVIELATPLPDGVPIYGLNTEIFNTSDPAVLTLVGYGESGDGVRGYYLDPSFTVKRTGGNEADFYEADDEGTSTIEVFEYDFDGGGRNYGGSAGLGNTIETTLGGGDSGGPAFIATGNGLEIFGINTYTFSFGTNPWLYPQAPKFGSGGGGMVVSAYAEWISSVIAASDNTPPVADAGGPYWIDIGADLLLDGTGSSDPDAATGDRIVSYRWDIGADGSYEYSGATVDVPWADLAALPQPNVAIPIRLEVEDAYGATAIADTELTLLDNQPTAFFTADPTVATYDQEIAFDASGSYAGRPDRSIVDYEWDFDYDGQTFAADASGVTTTHSYPELGIYTVALQVTDDNVPPKTDLFTVEIDVSLGDQAPVADAGGPYWIGQGDDLPLDGSGSYDPDSVHGDRIVSYEWDLGGDGTFEYTGEQVLVTWDDLTALPLGATAIPVAFRVTDEFGLTSSDTGELRIFDTGVPVALADRLVLVRGSDGDDTLGFSSTDSEFTVDLNGQAFGPYAFSDVDSIVFDGGLDHRGSANPGGSISVGDQVLFSGDSSNETAKLWPDRAEFTRGATTLVVEYRNVEFVQAQMNKGTDDQVEIYGVDNPDATETLGVSWYHALLETAASVNLDAYGYEKLTVDSGEGKSDTARVFDSTADDVFYTEPGRSLITDGTVSDAGDLLDTGTYQVELLGFPETFAQSSIGHDTAIMHDSAASDGMLSYQGTVLVYDDTRDASGKPTGTYAYFRRARDFAEVVSIADQGPGSVGDAAFMHDSTYDDAFVASASPLQGTMTTNVGSADEKSVTARGYVYTYAYAVNGGTNTAELTDSSGDDWAWLEAATGSVRLYSPESPYASGPAYDFMLRVKGFDSSVVHADAGQDTARFDDSAAYDVFTGTPDYSELLSGGKVYRVDSFETVRAYSTRGGGDLAELYGADFQPDTFTAEGTYDELVKANLNWATVQDSLADYFYYIRGFKDANVYYRSSEDTLDIHPDAVDWVHTFDLDPPP